VRCPEPQTMVCAKGDDLHSSKKMNMTKDVSPTSVSELSPGNPAGARAATDESDLTYRVILVPIDFSEHSKKTIRYATRFAARYQASLRLLHVFQIPDYAVTQYEHRQVGSDQLKNQVDIAEDEARQNLEQFEKELLNQGVNVKAFLRVGYPLEEIIQVANDPEIDLIIIGSHGRSGIKRLLLGSTAQRVVEHAPCPVLVVKERWLKER
jgi:universal stress protein A